MLFSFAPMHVLSYSTALNYLSKSSYTEHKDFPQKSYDNHKGHPSALVWNSSTTQSKESRSVLATPFFETQNSLLIGFSSFKMFTIAPCGNPIFFSLIICCPRRPTTSLKFNRLPPLEPLQRRISCLPFIQPISRSPPSWRWWNSSQRVLLLREKVLVRHRKAEQFLMHMIRSECRPPQLCRIFARKAYMYPIRDRALPQPPFTLSTQLLPKPTTLRWIHLCSLR